MDPVLGTLSYHDPVTLQQRWVISRVLHDAVFQFTNGILQMRLEGPNQELITYSGSFKL